MQPKDRRLDPSLLCGALLTAMKTQTVLRPSDFFITFVNSIACRAREQLQVSSSDTPTLPGSGYLTGSETPVRCLIWQLRQTGAKVTCSYFPLTIRYQTIAVVLRDLKMINCFYWLNSSRKSTNHRTCVFLARLPIKFEICTFFLHIHLKRIRWSWKYRYKSWSASEATSC